MNALAEPATLSFETSQDKEMLLAVYRDFLIGVDDEGNWNMTRAMIDSVLESPVVGSVVNNNFSKEIAAPAS